MEQATNLLQMAGRHFDIAAFLRRPATILKSICLIFGACLWYVVTTGAYHKASGSVHHQICLYGGSATTCSFASALGFFAMIGAAVVIYIDVRFDNESSVPTRKRMINTDLAVTLCFAGIHLIAFFAFWTKIDGSIDENANLKYVKFGVLIAMFATFAWGGAAVFAYRRYAAFMLEVGIEKFESNGVQQTFEQSAPVSSANNSYQGVASATPSEGMVLGEGYGY